MSDRIAVIVNNTAGAGCSAEWTEKMAEKFRRAGQDCRVTIASTGSEVLTAARREVADDSRVIVAGGGDGTISAVASILVGTNTPLGILPLGTLNHFAKDLGIPLEMDAAIDHIIAGHHITIDVGEVNGRTFVNNSSIGLYPDVVAEREAEQRARKRGKWPAFFQAAMGVLRRYPFMLVRLTVDGKKMEQITPCVFVGNNEYSMEGLDLNGRKRLDGGILSVCLIQSQRRMALLRLTLRALFKQLRQSKDLRTMQATEVTVETRGSRRRVSADGQVTMMEMPLHYRIRPAALKVIVPKRSPAGEG